MSEPGDATKRAVAEVLHLPADVVPSGRGHRGPSGGALLAELPFDELEPGEFEDFAVSLARSLFPGTEPYRQGKSGHTQFGFDVTVERDGRVLAGIQCKRVREFGPKDVDKLVAATTMKADKAFIFLSRAASPAARAAIRAHRGWQLWDKNKLSHIVHEMPHHRSVPLVDRYFPLLRQKFLGVRLPGPWLEPALFFSRTGRSERSSHQWPLVGRDGMLNDLTLFATGLGGRVGVLVGRGGTGKTKMLHALCERLRAYEISVRFLERDPVIDHQAFEQLPAGRLLVVIDDAHDENAPVGKVVSGVLAANPAASVLLAMRPDGESRSRRQLRETGIDPLHPARWELTDLQLTEAQALAREVLGPEHAHAAPRLAAAARDCPFLLVTGAILVREDAVELHRFEGDDRLRRELIESLADTISSGPTDQPEVRQEVLRAVAALQPLRTDDGAFRDALRELTGYDFDRLVPHLSAWEDAGILLRRGSAYRVVPDLLGDALLVRAACARVTGAPTEYLDRVRRAVRGRAMANLIVNASRIDWQEPAVRRGRLVASLWQAVTAEFQAGDAGTRIAVLDMLAGVAFYQPGPCVAIVRWALDHPAAPAPAQGGWELSYTDQDVRDAAASVLRAVAFDPDVLPDAAGLLWELGRSDARPTNQHPNHALRVLADIAQFDRRGVTIYQQSLPAIVERWLRRPQRGTDVHDPLIVLHPLLAAEGHDQMWSPDAVTFHPFLIPPDAPPVIELRRQVLDLAFEQLASPDLRRAAAAVETIGLGLTGPLGGFGLQVTKQDRALWAKHFERTLTRLHDTVRTRPPDPVVCVALRDQLQWHAEHAASEISQAACKVLSVLPRRPEHELARALRGGPIDPPPDPGATLDYLDRHRANEQFLSACAATVADWPEREVITLIVQLLSDLHLALGDDAGRARPFLSNLVTVRPDVGEALCARVQEKPGSPLTPLVSTAVSTLAQAGDPRAIKLALQLLDTRDIQLARQVARAFGIERGRTNILDGEAALLRTLVEHPDPDGIVPAAALGAVRYLAAQHQDLAVGLLTCVPDRQKHAALGEFALAFGPHGALAWEDLPQRHKDAFLDALRAAPSIENPVITEFLAMLTSEDPRTIIDLLTARVEAVEAGASPGTYSALPHAWPAALHFRDHGNFPDLLRRVREWLTAAPGSLWRHYLGSELFATVAGPFDAQTRQVIEEYLTEPDPIRIKTVSTILRGVPRTLVWDVGFVRGCLCAADSCGAESLAAVQNALHHALFTGVRRAAMGQPYPHDVEQRDTAAQLAAQAVRGSVEEQFYRALSQSAQVWIDRDMSEINLPADGRDW